MCHEIDETMNLNSKLYKKYMDAKLKLKRLKSITLTSVSVDEILIPTHATIVSVSPITQNPSFADNSLMLAHQINFDRFGEIQETEIGDVDVNVENEKTPFYKTQITENKHEYGRKQF